MLKDFLLDVLLALIPHQPVPLFLSYVHLLNSFRKPWYLWNKISYLRSIFYWHWEFSCQNKTWNHKAMIQMIGVVFGYFQFNLVNLSTIHLVEWIILRNCRVVLTYRSRNDRRNWLPKFHCNPPHQSLESHDDPSPFSSPYFNSPK